MSMESMNIIVTSATRLTETDQFDPIELTTKRLVTLTHANCAGGQVTVRSKGLFDKDASFKCTICKQEQSVPLHAAIQDLRRTLLRGEVRLCDYNHEVCFFPATSKDSQGKPT